LTRLVDARLFFFFIKGARERDGDFFEDVAEFLPERLFFVFFHDINPGEARVVGEGAHTDKVAEDSSFGSRKDIGRESFDATAESVKSLDFIFFKGNVDAADRDGTTELFEDVTNLLPELALFNDFKFFFFFIKTHGGVFVPITTRWRVDVTTVLDATWFGFAFITSGPHVFFIVPVNTTASWALDGVACVLKATWFGFALITLGGLFGFFEKATSEHAVVLFETSEGFALCTDSVLASKRNFFFVESKRVDAVVLVEASKGLALAADCVFAEDEGGFFESGSTACQVTTIFLEAGLGLALCAGEVLGRDHNHDQSEDCRDEDEFVHLFMDGGFWDESCWGGRWG
jgi:hypothetical protein